METIVGEVPESAEEAMLLLRGSLMRLQNETGLVVVHEIDEADRDRFVSTLTEYQKLASNGNPHYWSDADAETPHVVTASPYVQLPGFAVQLRLSAELLQTSSYRNLIEAYQKRLIRSVLADAERRELFYEEELSQFRRRPECY